MLADDGKQPILMDFGSAVPARLLIKNRSMALAEQDRAGEHSTMPYRAPELFDVRSQALVLAELGRSRPARHSTRRSISGRSAACSSRARTATRLSVRQSASARLTRCRDARAARARRLDQHGGIGALGPF